MTGVVILFHVMLALTVVDSWDVAVGSEEGELIFTGLAKSESIKMAYDTRAVALDPRGQVLFVGTEDRSTPRGNITIFRIDLAGDRKPTPLIKKEGLDIPGIAYDGVDKTLYWTDTRNIYRVRLGVESATPETFWSPDDHQMPWSVAVDSCRRYLYWTNRNHTNPSIERAKLDGSHHEVLVTEDLFMPVGLAVDQQTERLYWCDNKENIDYSIEWTHLDGSSRHTLVSGRHHQTSGVAVGPATLYWSDSQNARVWGVPKARSEVTDERDITEVDSLAGYALQGIVAWSDGADLDDAWCYKRPVTPESPSRVLVETTTMTEGTVPRDYKLLYCLNGGTFAWEESGAETCVCPPGYTGARCDVSRCHNYCVSGSCHIEESGMPSCRCFVGHRGRQCEVSKCDGFCMHGGRCSLDGRGEPRCHCGNSYEGRRCEGRQGVDHLCQRLCTQGGGVVKEVELVCSCSEYEGSTFPPGDNDTWSQLSWAEGQQGGRGGVCSQVGPRDWASIAMSCVSVLLLVVIGVLAVKICQLRRRPRIKKRIIVNKNVAQLTSRPPGSGEQCEITIENCCNMNVCETPCFEPQLRTSKSSSKSDERRNLLVDMEEGACSPPVQQKVY